MTDENNNKPFFSAEFIQRLNEEAEKSDQTEEPYEALPPYNPDDYETKNRLKAQIMYADENGREIVADLVCRKEVDSNIMQWFIDATGEHTGLIPLVGLYGEDFYSAKMEFQMYFGTMYHSKFKVRASWFTGENTF